MRNSCRRQDGGIVNPPICSADSPLYTRGVFELQSFRAYGIIFSTKTRCFLWLKSYLFAMATSCRISKSACASKELPILKLHLPTVYQRKPRAKLAIINKHLSTAESAIGQVFVCNYVLFVTAMTIKGFIQKHYRSH